MSLKPEMIKEITITLPLPPKELSPNARPHYMAKARAVKAFRRVAGLVCVTAVGGLQPKWEKAIERTTFFHKTKANRDGDNALAALKPVWDGLQDSGLVNNDSGITHEPVVFEIDKEDPRIEIWIRRS